MNETPILKVLPIHGESHPLPSNVDKVVESANKNKELSNSSQKDLQIPETNAECIKISEKIVDTNQISTDFVENVSISTEDTRSGNDPSLASNFKTETHNLVLENSNHVGYPSSKEMPSNVFPILDTLEMNTQNESQNLESNKNGNHPKIVETLLPKDLAKKEPTAQIEPKAQIISKSEKSVKELMSNFETKSIPRKEHTVSSPIKENEVAKSSVSKKDVPNENVIVSPTIDIPNLDSDEESLFQTPQSFDDEFVEADLHQGDSKLETNQENLSESGLNNSDQDIAPPTSGQQEFDKSVEIETHPTCEIECEKDSPIRPQLEGALEKPIKATYVNRQTSISLSNVDQNEIDDFIDSIFQYEDNEEIINKSEVMPYEEEDITDQLEQQLQQQQEITNLESETFDLALKVCSNLSEEIIEATKSKPSLEVHSIEPAGKSNLRVEEKDLISQKLEQNVDMQSATETSNEDISMHCKLNEIKTHTNKEENDKHNNVFDQSSIHTEIEDSSKQSVEEEIVTEISKNSNKIDATQAEQEVQNKEQQLQQLQEDSVDDQQLKELLDQQLLSKQDSNVDEHQQLQDQLQQHPEEEQQQQFKKQQDTKVDTQNQQLKQLHSNQEPDVNKQQQLQQQQQLKQLHSKQETNVDTQQLQQQQLHSKQQQQLEEAMPEQQLGTYPTADKRRHFEVAIVNTSHIETDVDTPSSSSSSSSDGNENEHVHSSEMINSPPIEIRSDKRLPPVGCSSEDPASSGSASDDLEKGCYDSLDEDAKSMSKLRHGLKDGPRRRRTLPNVPPDFSQQQKRAFETLLEHQQQLLPPTGYIQPSQYQVPYIHDKPVDNYERFPPPFPLHGSYHELDPYKAPPAAGWRQHQQPIYHQDPDPATMYSMPEPLIEQKVNLERSRTFNFPQIDRSKKRSLPQVPNPNDSTEPVSLVDSPNEDQPRRASAEREVVANREFRGKPPVPRWAHQGAGGFLQFSGEEDSGCASLERSSVSPQPGRNKVSPSKQQQQQPEEERDACSFMWFDWSPAPKKSPLDGANVVRRPKKVLDLQTSQRRSLNRHSAPPGSLDFENASDVAKRVSSATSKTRLSHRNDVQPKSLSDLKRRKSSTTLCTNPERRRDSKSRFFLKY